MNEETFDDFLLIGIRDMLPFEAEEVEDIDDNSNGFYINLKNGDSYSITIMKCEE